MIRVTEGDRLELEALRAFVAVVETGSFLAASQRLRQPRATLHRRIGELEASVGVPLLARTPRGVEPTQAGRWWRRGSGFSRTRTRSSGRPEAPPRA